MDTESMMNPPKSDGMAIKQTGGKHHPVAQRLRLLRMAVFHENTTAFAARLGIGVARLSNIENGFTLSLDVANRIRAVTPGITLDWLYHGDERALPLDLVQRLRPRSPKG